MRRGTAGVAGLGEFVKGKEEETIEASSVVAIVDDLLLLFVKSHLYRFIFLFFFRLLFAEQIFALQVVNLLKSLTS